MKLADPKFEWLSFLAALGLMSRVPLSLVGNQQPLSQEHRARSPIWYPAVGLILGAFLTVLSITSPSSFPPLVEAALLLIVWVAFTGALHLDGLADSADAWVGGMGDRQRTLDIMKDPSCGPMAVVVLVLALLLKFVLIFSLLEDDLSSSLVLLAVPVVARAWLLPILFSMPYARESKFDPRNVQVSDSRGSKGSEGEGSGMATDIASGLSMRAAQISFALAQLLVLLIALFTPLGFGFWLVSLVVSLGLFALLRREFISRLGGYTGDLLGANIELQELALLLVCLFFI